MKTKIIIILSFLTHGLCTQSLNLMMQANHRDGIDQVIFNEASNKIITAGAYSHKIWDVASGRLIHTYRGSGKLSPNGKYLFLQNLSGKYELWNVLNKEQIRSYEFQKLNKVPPPDGKPKNIGKIEGVENIVFIDRDRGKIQVFFNANSDRLLVLSGDKKFQVFGLPNGEQLQSIFIPAAFLDLETIAMDRKGNYLAALFTDNGDQFIYVWNMTTAQKVGAFSFDGRSLEQLSFSPNGAYLIGQPVFDEGLFLWDLAKGVLIKRLILPGDKTSSNYNWAINPDNTSIAVSNKVQNEIGLFNLQSGSYLKTFSGHKNHALFSFFSQNGDYLISASRTEVIKWDVASGQSVYNIPVKNNKESALIPNSELDLLITGGPNSFAQLIHLGDGRVEQVFGPQSLASSVSEPNDSLREFLRVRKVLQEIINPTFENQRKNDKLFLAAFSPNGRLIATCNEKAKTFNINQLQIWDVQSGRLLREISNDNDEIKSITIDSVVENLVISNSNGTLVFWDLFFQDMSPVFSAVAHPRSSLRGSMMMRGSNYTVRISPDQQYLASNGTDKEVLIWNTQNGDLLHRFRAKNSNEGCYLSMAFQPSGKKLALGGCNYSLLMLDLETGEILWEEEGRTWSSPVPSLVFNKDGTSLATLGLRQDLQENEWIKLWDSNSGKLIRTFSSPETTQAFEIFNFEFFTSDYEYLLDFSPDGQTISLGLPSGKMVQWDISSGEVIQTASITEESISALQFSPDGKHIALGTETGSIFIWDVEQNKIIAELAGHNEPILYLMFDLGNQRLISGSQDHTIRSWDLESYSPQFVLSSFNRGEAWAIVTKDNYYMANRNGLDYIHFLKEDTPYLFEQFDLEYNRPDKVLASMPNSDSLKVQAYYRAYLKRLSKMGFSNLNFQEQETTAPAVQIELDFIELITQKNHVDLQISVKDRIQKLDRLLIFVNNVPVYGSKGISLRNLQTKTYQTSIKIPLSRGENKIQVSALNQGGAESLKAMTYITYDAPERQPDLYLISIGVSDYQAAGKNLQYAAKDARDIAAWYESAEGFQEVHTKRLTDEQVTKANILALKDWLRKNTRIDDQVLLYVSGHGLLDENYDFYYATHDIDFANPSERGILYDEIEGLLDGIPARKKLLLMDACHSGEYDKDAPPLTQAQLDSLEKKGITFKGFGKGDEEGAPVLGLQNSFEMMQQLFTDLRRGSGATVITSSSGVQVSYEDEEWANGAFTYAFLFGLKSGKADANGDGEITASEIQAFVGEYVPRLTEGLQVPTFRRENLEYNFRVW